MLRSIKEILPSVPGEIKDYFIPNKALAGDGDWSTTKDILEWVVETNKRNLLLS